MRRRQLILELPLHCTLMTVSLHLCFPLGRSRRLPLVACRFLLPWSRFTENRIVFGNVSWQLGPSLFILGMGIGLDMEWAGVAKFFGPTIAPKNPIVRLLRRGQGFWCPRAYVTAGRVLSPVSARASSPAQVKARSLRFGVRGALSLILLRNNADHFSIRGAHSLVPLWSNADLAVKGFLWNLARLISLVILSLSFMRSKFLLDFAFYIRHPGRTILLHLQTPKFCKNSKFPSPLMNQECCLDPGCRSWGKGSRGQRSSYLSTGQERKLSSFGQEP